MTSGELDNFVCLGAYSCFIVDKLKTSRKPLKWNKSRSKLECQGYLLSNHKCDAGTVNPLGFCDSSGSWPQPVSFSLHLGHPQKLMASGEWPPLVAAPTAFGRETGKEALFRSIICFPLDLVEVSLTIILNSARHNYNLSNILSSCIFLCKWAESMGPQGPHILSERYRNA